MQKNYGWIIAFLSLFGIIGSSTLKFVEFLTGNVYFSYYGIDQNLYDYSSNNYVYSLFLSLIYLTAYGFVLYSIKELYISVKSNRRISKNDFPNIILILISNLYLVLVYCANLSELYKIINFFIFIGLEIFSSYIIFKDSSNKNDESYVSIKQNIISFFKSLIFMIIILIMCNSLRIYFNLMSIVEYRTIKVQDDNKVIVYSTNDYYITLDCKIDDKNNKLIIYKGSQEKIDNTNVKSQLTKFDKVERK